MSKDWHAGHFCCWQCDESLTGQRYVLRDDHPYCIKCYESVFANTCEECSKTIGIDSKVRASASRARDVGHPSGAVGVPLAWRQPLCCFGCLPARFHLVLTLRLPFQDLSYKDKHWHEACFLCSKCRVSLVDKQFGSKADHIYCGNCYDAQFASRCDGCGEIFRAGE